MSRHTWFHLSLLTVLPAALGVVLPGWTKALVPGSKTPPKTITNSIGMKLARIPAGAFTMGSPKKEQEQAIYTGSYSFTGLTPGTYTITFTNDPVWYLYEYANVGTVNGAASGQMASTSSISQIQLTSGLTGVDYDFAEILAGS
jgi:hypothetical protein